MVEISNQAIQNVTCTLCIRLAHFDGHSVLLKWYDCVNAAAGHHTLKRQQVQTDVMANMKSDATSFERMEGDIDVNI